jgi:hypothetical protein
MLALSALSMTTALGNKDSQRLRECRWQRGEGRFVVHGVHVSFSSLIANSWQEACRHQFLKGEGKV